MKSYAECEQYAKSHEYNPLHQGWHLGGYLILRYHAETGNFRLFRQSVMIREYRSQPFKQQLLFVV